MCHIKIMRNGIKKKSHNLKKNYLNYGDIIFILLVRIMLNLQKVIDHLKTIKFTGNVVLSINQGGVSGIKTVEVKEKDISNLAK